MCKEIRKYIQLENCFATDEKGDKNDVELRLKFQCIRPKKSRNYVKACPNGQDSDYKKYICIKSENMASYKNICATSIYSNIRI